MWWDCIVKCVKDRLTRLTMCGTMSSLIAKCIFYVGYGVADGSWDRKWAKGKGRGESCVYRVELVGELGNVVSWLMSNAGGGQHRSSHTATKGSIMSPFHNDCCCGCARSDGSSVAEAAAKWNQT